jgi:hypothetical protein
MKLSLGHGATLGQDVCRVLRSNLSPVPEPLKIAFAQFCLRRYASLSREELNKAEE